VNIRSLALDGLTAVVAISAAVVAWDVMTRSNGPDELRDTEIANFEEIASEGHRVGPPSPPLTVVVWNDYECSVCRAMEPIISQLHQENPDSVAIVYRHYPLSYHAYGYPAAVAAECAAERNEFESFHELLFATDEWMTPRYRSTLSEMAGSLGLDPIEFEACLVEHESLHERVQRDVEAATLLEARGTPTIVVNGVYLGQPPRDADLDTWRSRAR